MRQRKLQWQRKLVDGCLLALHPKAETVENLFNDNNSKEQQSYGCNKARGRGGRLLFLQREKMSTKKRADQLLLEIFQKKEKQEEKQAKQRNQEAQEMKPYVPWDCQE